MGILSKQTLLAVSLDEAAVAAGFSRRTLERAVKAGDLPVVRSGRAVRVMLSDLQAWLERHRETAQRRA